MTGQNLLATMQHHRPGVDLLVRTISFFPFSLSLRHSQPLSYYLRRRLLSGPDRMRASQELTPPRVPAWGEMNDFAKVHSTPASTGGDDEDRF